MIVIENKHNWIWHFSDLVEQPCQHRFDRWGLGRLQRCLDNVLDVHFHGLERGDHIGPETGRIAVICVQRDPSYTPAQLAMSDPLNVVAMDTITLRMARPIHPVISSSTEVRQAIEAVYRGSDIEEQQLRDLVEFEVAEGEEWEEPPEEDAEEAETNAEVAASKAPVIRFVDLLLRQAVKSRASDIHIEPQEKSMMIRMRVDGALHEMVPPARKMQASVVTRIKILSDMETIFLRLSS